ncbi:hypothetical protein ACIQYS_05340 [Psychrobacillus sp. NPDC096426]|uniref:hypothetical protein n=1 Tax=Psychrobacillus sp. NPDC096426 TaxID=3364491 RepID=UPI003803FC14
MKIKWINGQHAEDNRIFDSLIEAYEWTDSLYHDFSNNLISRVKVGYATPDAKVIDYLIDFIPEWANYLNVGVNVNKVKTRVDGKIIYRIWVTYSSES